MANPKQKLCLINPIHLLAVGFGSGLFPIMPGTAGSLAGVVIWYFLLQGLPLLTYLLVLLIATLAGIYLCQKTSDDMGTHDHGSIVWDEFVGIWIVLMVIPVANWQWITVAFVLFRLFDMWKPWPISWLDRRVQGGFGIMIDDVVAGIIAAGIILLVNSYLIV